MKRRTTDRSSAGHRHDVRKISDAEATHLLELKKNIGTASQEFKTYVVHLYESGVSQQSTAEKLNVSQGAIHLLLRRYYDQKLESEHTDAIPETVEQQV